MKIAIFGKLKQATSYHDWYTCFRRQLREVPISEFLITGGNTVLNRYVKHYAKSLAISVKEYHLDETLTRCKQSYTVINALSVMLTWWLRAWMNKCMQKKVILKQFHVKALPERLSLIVSEE